VKHEPCEQVALAKLVPGELEQPAALQPGHGEQAAGGKLRQHFGDMDLRHVGEQMTVKRDMARLAGVVEFLAQAGGEFLADLGGIDGRVHAAVDGEDQLQLLEVGLDCRGHVGILQLAGQLPPVMGNGPVDLTERGRGGRFVPEAREFLLPVGTELRRHAPAHEGPAHGRGLALQLAEFGGVFGGQGIGDGGHELGHLHQRPLEPAERFFQETRLVGPVALVAGKQPPRGDSRRRPADPGADPGIAADPAGKPVGLVVARRLVVQRQLSF